MTAAQTGAEQPTPAKPLHNCSALTASSCEEPKVKRCVVKHQSCGALRAEVWDCRPNTPLREALRVAPPPQLPKRPLGHQRTPFPLSHRIGLCCSSHRPQCPGIHGGYLVSTSNLCSRRQRRPGPVFIPMRLELSVQYAQTLTNAGPHTSQAIS